MQPITNAVLLDARQNVATARTKVTRSGLAQVAVRRTVGLVVFWYVFETQHVLARFQAFDDKSTVKQALDLHEHSAAQVGDIDTVSVSSNTVILDGSNFIGVQLSTALPELDLLSIPDIEAPLTFTSRSTSGPGSARRFTRRHQASRENKSAEEIQEYGGSSSLEKKETEGPLEVETYIGYTPAKKPSVPEISTAFTAYPRLDAPAMVSPLEQFSITIGLASQQLPGTVGGPLTIDLPSTVECFELDVLVVADGFGMPAGGRHRLEVDRQNLNAHSISVPLVAPEFVDEALLTTISVIYFYEKVPCGTAARRIAVAPVGTQLFTDTQGIGKLWSSGDESRGAVSIQSGVQPIDLTVTISKPDGNPASGQFVWSFQSPHVVTFPALPVMRDLGMDARELGTHIIEGIQNSEAQDMVELEIAGLGKDIADRMPVEFWNILREVNAATVGKPPTVLFLTAEAHVPWELALVEPPLDAGAPPYLGCQVNMARWPLSDSGNPPLPPAASIEIHQFAVVVGDYAARSGWRKLEKAELEGSSIVSRYGAIKLNAEPTQIKQLLTAKPLTTSGHTRTEAVHFACHGEATQGNVLDAAIILGAGQRMSPTWLANSPLGKQCQPFLFLNACQVGKAGELLGSFSGFAGESLKGGFRGFLAPLWSVDDGLAHDIALEFYDRVFGMGEKPQEPIASILRDLRRRFAPDTEKGSATRLAYVFYGHPSLTMCLK